MISKIKEIYNMYMKQFRKTTTYEIKIPNNYEISELTIIDRKNNGIKKIYIQGVDIK